MESTIYEYTDSSSDEEYLTNTQKGQSTPEDNNAIKRNTCLSEQKTNDLPANCTPKGHQWAKHADNVDAMHNQSNNMGNLRIYDDHNMLKLKNDELIIEDEQHLAEIWRNRKLGNIKFIVRIVVEIENKEQEIHEDMLEIIDDERDFVRLVSKDLKQGFAAIRIHPTMVCSCCDANSHKHFCFDCRVLVYLCCRVLYG